MSPTQRHGLGSDRTNASHSSINSLTDSHSNHNNTDSSDSEDINALMKVISPSMLRRVSMPHVSSITLLQLIDVLLDKLLRQAQAEKNELRAAKKNTEKELANKENESVPSQSRSRSKKSVSHFNEAEIREIKDIASKFTYMSFLWLRNMTYTFKLDLDEDFEPAERFKDTGKKCQGQFQDLLTAIPEKWHSVMNNNVFYSIVSLII